MLVAWALSSVFLFLCAGLVVLLTVFRSGPYFLTFFALLGQWFSLPDLWWANLELEVVQVDEFQQCCGGYPLVGYHWWCLQSSPKLGTTRRLNRRSTAGRLNLFGIRGAL